MNDEPTSYHEPVDLTEAEKLERRDRAIRQLKAWEPKPKRWERLVTWGAGLAATAIVLALLHFLTR